MVLDITDNDRFCKQILEINTDKTNDEIIPLVQSLIDDANTKLYQLNFMRSKNNGDNYIICQVIASGKTSAYCKGIASEVKKYIEDIFGKKNVTRTFYAY